MPTMKEVLAENEALKQKLAAKNGPLTITEGEYKGNMTLTYSGPFFKRIGVNGNAKLIAYAAEAMRQSPALKAAVESLREVLLKTG